MIHHRRPQTAPPISSRGSRPGWKPLSGGAILFLAVALLPACEAPSGKVSLTLGAKPPAAQPSPAPHVNPPPGPFPANFHVGNPDSNGGSATPLTSTSFRVSRVSLGEGNGKHQLGSTGFSIQGGDLDGL